MATSTLASLKFTSAKKPTQLAPVQVRRNKLVGKLVEQIAIAKGKQSGTPYVMTKIVAVTNESGQQEIVEVPKRLKEWFWAMDNGKIALTVRYGARVLVLNAKGMTAIEVASMDELVSTLELVKSAVEAGELDAAIEAAGASLRNGFKH